MEMEFKDNSRRRTLVLVVGVLLALGAGAAAFMLSSQGTEEPEVVFPTRDVVVASDFIPARETITLEMLELRPLQVDESNAGAFVSPEEVANSVAAISILANQPITPYMLAQAQTAGSVTILDQTEIEEFTADTPNYRAVSLIVPPERAVGGYITTDDRVDVIATFPMEVTLGTDPETGETIEGESQFTTGSSTKLMWLDVKIITRPEETSDVYIVRADLQTAEEIAHAQNQGAQFTMALRPDVDTRDVDRSNYGETNDTLLTRYNFRIPEVIEADGYPQPEYFPTPFPNEPYIDFSVLPSPTPDGAIVEIPVDETVGGSPLPEESPAP